MPWNLSSPALLWGSTGPCSMLILTNWCLNFCFWSKACVLLPEDFVFPNLRVKFWKLIKYVSIALAISALGCYCQVPSRCRAARAQCSFKGNGSPVVFLADVWTSFIVVVLLLVIKMIAIVYQALTRYVSLSGMFYALYHLSLREIL